MEYVSNLTSKGQVTIPASIRKVMHLKPRDKIAFLVENGTVRIERANSDIRELSGKLHVPGFKSMKALEEDTARAVANDALKRDDT